MSDGTRTMRDSDLDGVRRVTTVAFASVPELVDRWVERAGMTAWRVHIVDGEVAATALRVPMGMWFHGRSVSNLGIAGVATEAIYRGRGLAATLMRDVLREAHEEGTALSTLYPSNRALYRSVGYELAGDHFEVTIDLKALPRRSNSGDVARWQPADREAIRALQSQYAKSQHGALDRGSYIWARVENPRMKPADGYVFRYDGQVEGYVFIQLDSDNVFYDVSVSDWCVASPRALDGLMAFLSRFSSLGNRLRYTGSSGDLMTAQLPERCFEVRLEEPFMLRIVDVGRALSERGYDPSTSARLSIAVTEDASLPENVGVYRLDVRDGGAEVTPGASSPAQDREIRGPIQGLAALYAGYLPARQLATMGWIEGDEASLRSAESIFGTQRACLSEMF